MITVICKASAGIGLGHLIRTSSLISQALAENESLVINYVIIGDTQLKEIATKSAYSVTVVENEENVLFDTKVDFIFVDMTEVHEKVISYWKKMSKRIVVISPIFNHFDKADYYFGRTKYLNFERNDFPNLKVYAGLEFSIIQDNCFPISEEVYEHNLGSESFQIAITMGGGDAKNKSLKVLRALKNCKVPATFWVMIGERYQYSLDDLVREIREDTAHEIILAKTNASMWRILNNCVLCILPGGITSYESVYAGLPSINFFDQENQRFLLKEIVEHEAAWDFGIYSDKTLENIVTFIERLYEDRKLLMQMHVKSKSVIDKGAVSRIIKTLGNHEGWYN